MLADLKMSLSHVAAACFSALSATFGSIYHAVESVWYTVSYPEPEMVAEAGGKMVFKLFYRVGMRRYSIFFRAMKPVPPPIVGARIYCDDVSIQVGNILQELAGPFGDYHGQKISGRDILDHYISEDDLCGLTRSVWINDGEVETTTMNGTMENGCPKLESHVMSLGISLT